jgi:hypothetical protein
MLYGGDSRTTCDGSAAGVESVAVGHLSTTFNLRAAASAIAGS